MRSYTGLGWVLYPITDVLIRRDTELRKRSTQGIMPCEDRGEKPKTPRTARNCQKPGKGKDGFFPETFRESMALPDTLILRTSSLQNCGRINICYIKPHT